MVNAHVALEQPTLQSFDPLRTRRAQLITGDHVSMSVVETSISHKALVRVLSISQRGMKLQSPSPLLPGTLVGIHLKDTIIIGEVRYCAQRGHQYHLGILEQDDVSKPLR